MRRSFGLRLMVVSVALACSHAVRSHPAFPEASNPMPRYPSILRSASLDGTVEVAVPVSAEGRVESRPRVVQSSHELFTAAVWRAVAGWRFRPAAVGRAVRADTVHLRFTFVLDTARRCGPMEITRRPGDPWPGSPSDTVPVTTFDTETLAGTIAVCRLPRVLTRLH